MELQLVRQKVPRLTALGLVSEIEKHQQFVFVKNDEPKTVGEYYQKHNFKNDGKNTKTN